MRRWQIVAMAAVACFAGTAASSATEVESRNRYVIVDAPTTHVEVSRKQTKVNVVAPYTSVKVDKRARKVRIRVPFFNSDIRW